MNTMPRPFPISFWRWMIALGWFISGLFAWAAPALPPPPATFVYDEPQVVGVQTRGALQDLLSEQERATGEQIIIAVFNSLEGEDLVSWTNQIFQHWKIGKKGKDNGVLLALYWKDRKARIEVGYGLEDKLTDAQSKRILSEFLVPELKQGQTDQGLKIAAFQILRVLDSPLIQSGQAEKILQGSTSRQGAVKTVSGLGTGTLIFLLILVILAIRILSPLGEMHYSRGGWTRRRRGWGGPWGGGWGGGGGWPGGGSSGGGGFSGGGGSSGGGGASDSW